MHLETESVKSEEAVSLEEGIAKLLASLQKPSSLQEKKTLKRTQVKIRPVDALALIKKGESEKKFFWSDRERSRSWLGFGAELTVSGEDSSQLLCEKLPQILGAASDKIQLFGGMKFANLVRCDDSYRPFPQLFFVLPKIEIDITKEGTSIALNEWLHEEEDKEQAVHILESLLAVSAGNECMPGVSEERHVLSKEQWHENVSKGLEWLSRGEHEKIVLANAHDFWFDGSIDAAQILAELDKRCPSTYRFLMQLSSEEAFVGASPEKLYKRDGLRIESEAQAGTRKRGESDSADEALGKELIDSNKEFVEHDLVFQDILTGLSKLCRDCGAVDQRKIVKLSNVQHLRSRFRGILKDGVSDAKILEQLHPTPAVCGRPVEAANEMIAKLEKFDRGYYCGPVGMIGAQKTEFAVAIRSALVRKNKMRLFAGAGIVTGSRAEDEWNEIESKMRPFYEILNR